MKKNDGNKSVFTLNDSEYELTQRALQFLHGYWTTEGPAPGISKEDHWNMLQELRGLMKELQEQKRWNKYINEQFNEVHEVNDNG